MMTARRRVTLKQWRSRFINAVVCATCAFLASGCANPFSPDGPMLWVSHGVQTSALSTTVFRAQVGSRNVTVQAPPVGTPYAETQVVVPQYGSVPVHATLLNATGQTLATVQFSQEFRRGETHWITATVGTARPIGFCIGTLAVAPLNAAGSDSLFVTYGSIPDGAVC